MLAGKTEESVQDEARSDFSFSTAAVKFWKNEIRVCKADSEFGKGCAMKCSSVSSSPSDVQREVFL